MTQPRLLARIWALQFAGSVPEILPEAPMSNSSDPRFRLGDRAWLFVFGLLVGAVGFAWAPVRQDQGSDLGQTPNR